MSQIKIKQIDDNNLVVMVSSETPIETINELTKGFIDRGLTEDLSKSTVSTRYFFRTKDKVQDLADELIKSLNKMRSPENVARDFAHQKAKRDMQQQQRTRSATMASAIPRATPNPPTASAAATLHPVPNQLAGQIGGQAKKSDYGPKGAGLYDRRVNDRRKANNLSDERVPGAGGPSASVKALSTKPGQLSAKQQADAESKKAKKLSGPVRKYTPAEIAALEEARKLKKNTEDAPWDRHATVPNADEQVQLYQKVNPAVPGEDAMSLQLANMMKSKAMMRPDHRQPSSEEMIMAGQAMGLVPSEEMQKTQEQQWGGAINNWLAEASKPISSRFQSEEEELAYWSSIKVNGGKTGGDYGF